MPEDGYIPQPFPGFAGGLNLRADVTDPSQAIDLLNVAFDGTSVKQRYGYTSRAGTLTGTASNITEFFQSTGTDQILLGTDTRVDALDTATSATVASSSGLSAGIPFSFVRFAAPGSEFAYAGNGVVTLRKWDGAAWSAPTATVDGTGSLAMPKAATMAVMPVSNRLVVGGFGTTTGGPNGAATSPSTVYFSGDTAGISPEIWNHNNFIQVTPGDGEKVHAIVAWKNLVFVFKETKYAIIYGESTAADGSAIFNYRVVDAGVGAVNPRAVCVAHDGVYFVHKSGVYRTTGNEAVCVSDPIAPMFNQEPPPFLTANLIDRSYWGNIGITEWEKDIYLPITVSGQTTNTYVLVYSTLFDTWTLWDLPCIGIGALRSSVGSALLFTTSSYLHQYTKVSPATNDFGGAIHSYWRSGWFDYGLSNDKTIRESKLWGSGKVSMAISHDFDTATGTADLVDLTPSSAALKGKLRRRAVRGTVFSTYLSNSTLDQSWRLDRLTHHLREQRIESVVTA